MTIDGRRLEFGDSLAARQVWGMEMSESNGNIVEVTVPHLAESLVSATVGTWLKQPGDTVEQYDVLCELFTEKVDGPIGLIALFVKRRFNDD
ncbi:hypothetical protein SD70_25890 [Gordoniibacillus kamchatkensis]|uniref:Lipoyl-binding domain-containing protein n=1 Tax=Gordoniibacillus kamchatkensis TaxID=1590651 RepID=A0ABR5ABW0_9BACL|nr:hypothetical protein SD70_25890 [Paenibacillus sp. VKM B-2647]